jgi:hypothetical protein
VAARRPAIRGAGLARVLLWILAAVAAETGIWALATPTGFYERFPGVGPYHWVAELPPYNEHLVRDVGAFYVAFAVLLAAAAIVLERRLVIVALLAFLTAQVPHLVFHVNHLEGLAAVDKTAQVGSLALAVLAALVVLALALWPGARRPDGDRA